MRIVTIIPARKNSKGIPDKNIKEFCGEPLISHTIKQAISSSLCGEVYVSTDSDEIKAISEEYGANVIIRPESLATDIATSESVLIHSIHSIEGNIDIVVFLQCTSPLRRENDLDSAINKFIDGQYDSLFSVVFSEKYIWKGTSELIEKSINFDYGNRQRRQERSENGYWLENGSIYIFKPIVLEHYNNRIGGKIGMYEMPLFTQYEIDTPMDFDICELVYEKELCKNEQK